jgi:hypothetical protein
MSNDAQGITNKTSPNPANQPEKAKQEYDYPAMDVPTARLGVPEMPGYYLYWHLGKNVPRAMKSGYTFVDQDEVELNDIGLANKQGDGNTDLGTRVSLAAGFNGAEQEDGDRLYLMKKPIELHRKHEAQKEAVNEGVAAAIRGGTLGAERDPDKNQRYMKEGQRLFYPKGTR